MWIMREPGSIFPEIILTDDGIGTLPAAADTPVVQLTTVAQKGLPADQSPEPRAESLPLNDDPIQKNTPGFGCDTLS